MLTSARRLTFFIPGSGESDTLSLQKATTYGPSRSDGTVTDPPSMASVWCGYSQAIHATFWEGERWESVCEKVGGGGPD